MTNPQTRPQTRSPFQTAVHYLQFTLASLAAAFFTIWLGMIAWELYYSEILIADYLSGFSSWAIIMLMVRRIVIFTCRRPARSDDRPAE